MRTRTVWGWSVAAVMVAGLSVGACGLGKHGVLEEDDDPFSASMLDDPADDEGMFAGMLTPAERAALERSRVSEPRPGETIDTALPEEAPPKESSGESTLDTAGKMGLSFLTVGLTLAAAAAPFFLF